MILFEGAAAAMITPFCNGEVDYNAFETLINELHDRGINTFIVCGSTGEPHGLTPFERKKLVQRAAFTMKGKALVVAGLSQTNTYNARKEGEIFKEAGADALLAITPFCSKCTEDGLVEHYRQIKQHSQLPIIAYNVPSRTGYDLNSKCVRILCEQNLICGVKQASPLLGNAIKIKKALVNASLYCGEDNLTAPMRTIGSVGSISVLANILPEAAVSMFSLSVEESGALQVELDDFIQALFIEVNPVPVKYLLSAFGKCKNEFRLPLTPLSEEKASVLKRCANALGVFPKSI